MPPRILVAALNWGLGHASRCVPIIQTLQSLGASVVLASDGEALALLRAEFPDLPALELPSYGVRYQGQSMIWNMAPQVPRILSAIRAEKRWLAQLLASQPLDAVLSDNRYGLYNAALPCVLLTHQINIQIPNAFLRWGVQRLNRFYIQRFQECWIPDAPSKYNLAGDLAHGYRPRHARYIGPLSRMKALDLPKRYDLVAVLSGPEPQRSKFEAIFLAQALNLPHLRFLLIQGKPEGQAEHYFLAPHIEVHNFLPYQALNRAIASGHCLLARSGYSTVMDLVQMQLRKVILVPTPGQTEQEYLAQRLAEQGCFLAQSQAHFDLRAALDAAEHCRGFTDPLPNTSLPAVLREWLQHLPRR